MGWFRRSRYDEYDDYQQDSRFRRSRGYEYDDYDYSHQQDLRFMRPRQLSGVGDGNPQKQGHNFEKFCGEILNRVLDGNRWRIDHGRKFPMGNSFIKADFHIAERRQGNISYVIDCKHYPTSNIRDCEVKSTLLYKKKFRAKKAFIFLSKDWRSFQGSLPPHPSFINALRAHQGEIQLIQIPAGCYEPGFIRWFQDQLFGRELRRELGFPVDY